MSKRTRDTSFQPPQAPQRMRGSERGRPSMGIQNLDTMGTVYWTASEEEATEFGAGAGREDATRRTRTTTTLRLRPSHFAATNFGHEAMLFLELAFTTAMMVRFSFVPWLRRLDRTRRTLHRWASAGSY